MMAAYPPIHYSNLHYMTMWTCCPFRVVVLGDYITHIHDMWRIAGFFVVSFKHRFTDYSSRFREVI